MNRRTEIDSEDGISPYTTAGGETAPPPTPFVNLGSAAQAVVLTLANKRIRLKVARADERREDGGAGC